MAKMLLDVFEGLSERLTQNNGLLENLYNDWHTDVRNENRKRLAHLGQQVYDESEPITEEQEANNNILLLAGEHGSFSLSKAWTTLHGAPGALVKDKGVVRAHAVIENMEFRRLESSENNESTLLHIRDGAKVLIRDCIFQRRAGDPSDANVATDDSFILIENGCKVVITNCVFRSDATDGAMAVAAGKVVKHRGAAGNVYVGTGFNLTGQAHLNVTAIAPELT